MIKSDEIIGKILDNAEVGAGMHVLDVACGTGVMFDYYPERNVASVTGIDIAPEMSKSAISSELWNFLEYFFHYPPIRLVMQGNLCYNC